MKIVTMGTSIMKEEIDFENISWYILGKVVKYGGFRLGFMIQAMNNQNQGAGQVWTPPRQTTNKEIRGTQRQFSEIICSEDDLRSRIFGSFSVKFLACLLLLGFWNIKKNGIIAHF